jgi:hypothetical protein
MELTFFPAIAVALVILLLAAIISIFIQFEGGINPKDDNKSSIVFWVFAILNPIVYWLLAYFYLAPDPEESRRAYNRFIEVIPTDMLIGGMLYIIVGIIVSKLAPTGKLGHWFPKKNNK